MMSRLVGKKISMVERRTPLENSSQRGQRTSGDSSTRCPNLRVRIVPFSIYVFISTVSRAQEGGTYSLYVTSS